MQADRARLEGLDLARFLALVAMVFINFRIAMGALAADESWLSFVARSLEGRAAATFVVLAGVGIGLASKGKADAQTVRTMLARAVFLLVAGLLNAALFEADILHFYAFYFAIATFVVAASSRTLMVLSLAANAMFIALLLSFDYDAGWDWTTYSYEDLWTARGFVRHVFFNGWHPVLPWITFVFIGIVVSRLELQTARVQRNMLVVGIAACVVAEASSHALTHLGPTDPEATLIFGTSPVPPVPLYMVAGLGFATATIGGSLLAVPWLRRMRLLNVVAPAGRQTLTLYIAHILIGMGTLDALGMLGEQHMSTVFGATALFVLPATLFARWWSFRFKRGPLESLMRRLCG